LPHKAVRFFVRDFGVKRRDCLPPILKRREPRHFIAARQTADVDGRLAGLQGGIGAALDKSIKILALGSIPTVSACIGKIE
jgi:hypothetical protein